MGVPSLNDLAVDGTFNTTNQPNWVHSFTYISGYSCPLSICSFINILTMVNWFILGRNIGLFIFITFNVWLNRDRGIFVVFRRCHHKYFCVIESLCLFLFFFVSNNFLFKSTVIWVKIVFRCFYSKFETNKMLLCLFYFINV